MPAAAVMRATANIARGGRPTEVIASLRWRSSERVRRDRRRVPRSLVPPSAGRVGAPPSPTISTPVILRHEWTIHIRPRRRSRLGCTDRHPPPPRHERGPRGCATRIAIARLAIGSARTRLLPLVRLSSEWAREAVRQDCSFAKKQDSPPGAPGRRPLQVSSGRRRRRKRPHRRGSASDGERPLDRRRSSAAPRSWATGREPLLTIHRGCGREAGGVPAVMAAFVWSGYRLGCCRRGWCASRRCRAGAAAAAPALRY